MAIIEAGDIYIKRVFTKDPVSHIIRGGQLATLGSKHANYVHAGIAVSEIELVESQGEGVVVNNINKNIQHGYAYQRFRYIGDDAEGIISTAVEFALQQLARNVSYNVAKAGRSLFGKRTAKKTETKGLLGKSTYFCSELVVDCYANADESLFNGVKSRLWSPSALYTHLKNNKQEWRSLGLQSYEVY